MEKKTTTRCERILAAFSHLKMKGLVKTQQDVADMMGANKTTISQAFKGNETYLTDKFLARFNATFNDMFNIGWLITGKGDMLDGVQHPADGVMVPVVPLSAVGGTLRDIHQGNVTLEDCEVMRAPVNNAEYAIGVYGDSMAPTYPSGCRVFIRRIDPTSFISWGSVFVLDTVNGIYIKEVQKGHDDNYILCISHNTSGRYPAFEIPLRDVFGMYRVLASIRYSWATIAASLDIPKETIARALGHGGHSVTDIYIDFDQRKVDDANRLVIDWVLYGRK